MSLFALLSSTALAQVPQQPAPATSQTHQPQSAANDARNPGVIQLMNQVEGLQTEINRLHGQLEVLSNGLENAQKRQRDMYLDLDTRVRRIEQQVPGAASPRSEGPPQPRAEASAARAEAGPSDFDVRLKRLEQQSGTETPKAREGQADLEARIKRLEQLLTSQASPTASPPTANPPSTAATVPAPVPPVKPTPPTLPSTSTAAGAPNTAGASESGPARKAYDAGLASYRSGDYQGAIATFDGIVKRYPRDPLAANAQYWIGDSWFNLRDFRSAVAAQQALVANYPDSPKIPDALLNLSSAYAAMGESANARRALEDLIARFPQTDAAEKGRQRLARLR